MKLKKPIQYQIIENSFLPESASDFQNIYINNEFATFDLLKNIGLKKHKDLFLKWLMEHFLLIKNFKKDNFDFKKASDVLRKNDLYFFSYGSGYTFFKGKEAHNKHIDWYDKNIKKLNNKESYYEK